MGLFDRFKTELIDIIEWIDDSRDTMVFRFERHDNEIKNGAKLIVRESQVAVFIEQGQFADLFTPGTYTLSTENLPILSTFVITSYSIHYTKLYECPHNDFGAQCWKDKSSHVLLIVQFGNNGKR